ncbi:MAG: response regulator [Verrucomicrobia bacterium]|nr:response regulator [Verrucomicrobiota bacterium]
MPKQNQLVVLTIDDHASQRARIAEMLEGPSVRVIEAASVADALEVLERDQPQLVTLDIVFDDDHESDGYRFCARLKERLPEVPIIAISSRGRGVDKSLMQTRGAADYIPKSELTRERLRESVLAVLPAAAGYLPA